MLYREPIRMAFTNVCGIKKVPTFAYDVDFTKTRWFFIARLCWKLLVKLGCVGIHFDEQHMVTRVFIDQEKAASYIIKEAYHQIEQLNGRLPTKVLMGREQFEKLTNELLPSMYVKPFDFSVAMSQNGRVFDLPVEVIPWMDGILVL